MSPVGLDVQFYNWAVFQFVPLDATEQQIIAEGWLVTKCSVYAAPDVGASLRFLDQRRQALGGVDLVTIAPGGCYVAEPGGAYRAPIRIQGAGAKIVIEFWFQARTGFQTPFQGGIPEPTVTPV